MSNNSISENESHLPCGDDLPIFPSACQEGESPVTHSNLCSGGICSRDHSFLVYPSSCPTPPPPWGGTQGLFFTKISPCWADTHRVEQQWCGYQGWLDLLHQSLGFSCKTGMAVAMEARAEGGRKPGTCQEGGGEWLCDRLVELNFFLF